MSRMSPTYTCDACHGEFPYSAPSTWSESDALSEFASNFPGEPIDAAALVCDACFLQMTAQVPLPIISDIPDCPTPSEAAP